MLEWVCPRCGRDVDPGLRECPFCGATEAAPPNAKTPEPGRIAGRRIPFADVGRGWRWGLGFIAGVTLMYTALLYFFYLRGEDEWVGRMLHWIGVG